MKVDRTYGGVTKWYAAECNDSGWQELDPLPGPGKMTDETRMTAALPHTNFVDRQKQPLELPGLVEHSVVVVGTPDKERLLVELS